jgi:hypothetical protein
MWWGVTSPEPQMEMNRLSAAQHEYLFSAYTDPRRIRLQRRHLLYPLVALAVGALGYGLVTYHPAATPYRLETHRGLRTVRKGMSPQDVSGILGQPVGRERRGNQECLQYGRPSLKVASFILNTLCYEDGKLLEVYQRHYNSWIVTREGAVSPALEALEELVPPRDAPAPSPAGSAPGVAGPTTP